MWGAYIIPPMKRGDLISSFSLANWLERISSWAKGLFFCSLQATLSKF